MQNAQRNGGRVMGRDAQSGKETYKKDSKDTRVKMGRLSLLQLPYTAK